MSDEAKPDDRPIPREEPPPPAPAAVENPEQRTLRLLEQINVGMGTLANTQSTHGAMLAGITNKLTEHDQAIAELRSKAPGSNPPPRTASGFTAAVRQISQTNESDKDRELAARLDGLASAIAAVDKKTDLQTELLHTLVEAGQSLIKNPWVRRTAYVFGLMFVSYVSHLATQHGVTLP